MPLSRDRVSQMCLSPLPESFGQRHAGPASREGGLRTASPQAGGQRCEETFAAGGSLARAGGARPAAVCRARLGGAGAGPALAHRRGLAGWKSRGRGPGPRATELAPRGRGRAGRTHVPLSGQTTCSVCTAACGTARGNRTDPESSRNSQALPGNGWATAGRGDAAGGGPDSVREQRGARGATAGLGAAGPLFWGKSTVGFRRQARPGRVFFLTSLPNQSRLG